MRQLASVAEGAKMIKSEIKSAINDIEEMGHQAFVWVILVPILTLAPVLAPLCRQAGTMLHPGAQQSEHRI